MEYKRIRCRILDVYYLGEKVYKIYKTLQQIVNT